MLRIGLVGLLVIFLALVGGACSQEPEPLAGMSSAPADQDPAVDAATGDVGQGPVAAVPDLGPPPVAAPPPDRPWWSPSFAESPSVAASPPPPPPPLHDVAAVPPVAAGPPERAAADIDVFLEGLPEEAIAFNVPEHLLIDETVEVRLVIQPGQQAEALGLAFDAARSTRQTGEAAVESARISEEMGASLVSETLEVTAKRPERQAISRRQPTEWLWAVKADEGGEQSLTLNLYAIQPGSTAGRSVRVYDRVMRVEVPLARRLAGFASNNWEWMWTFLLAPLGVWYTRRRKAANA